MEYLATGYHEDRMNELENREWCRMLASDTLHAWMLKDYENLMEVLSDALVTAFEKGRTSDMER